MDSESSNSTLSATEFEEHPLNENFYEDLTYQIKLVYESCSGLVRDIQRKKRESLPRNKAAHIRRDRALTAVSSAERDLKQKEANFDDMDEHIELLKQQMVVAQNEHHLSLINNETSLANAEAAGESVRHLSMKLHKYKVAWRMARKYVGNHFRMRVDMNKKPYSALLKVAKDEPRSSSESEEEQSLYEDLNETLISRIQSVRKSYTELMRDIKRKILETSKRRYVAYVRRYRAADAVSSSRYDLEQKGANLKAISERIQLLQQQQEVAQQELQLSLTNYYNCLDEKDAAEEAFRQSLNDVKTDVGQEPSKHYHHYR